MKILIAMDDSPCSREAVEELIRRPWPPDSEVRVVSVAHAVPVVPDPFFLGAAAHYESSREEKARAEACLEWARNELAGRAPGLAVSTSLGEGSPKEVLLDEAERWGADLILIGSRGRGPVTRFLLGSVSQAVVQHAPCSVEVVRHKSR